MGLPSLIVIVPSHVARVELPRRLIASRGRALAGPLFLTLEDLATRVAGPAFLAARRRPHTRGHAALLAETLLDDFSALQAIPVTSRLAWASALARSLIALREGEVAPEALRGALAGVGRHEADQARLDLVAAAFERFTTAVESDDADPSVLWRTAAASLSRERWPSSVPILLAEDLEPSVGAARFLSALSTLCPVRRLPQPVAEGLAGGGFGEWARRAGIAPDPGHLLAPLWTDAHGSLLRLQESLFAAPRGSEAWDSRVELVTAAGDAAEATSIARRILGQAARGVPFEEMAILLPRPDPYVTLFTELLDRLGVPFRVHPSLPLGTTRLGRSLRLLLRCRGLGRAAVMELLSFAPIPFAAMLGEKAKRSLGLWDRLSRDAGIVSSLERWIIGLRHLIETRTEDARAAMDEADRERALAWVEAAEHLLRLVEILAGSLDALSGEASWHEWSARLRDVCDQWLSGPRADGAAEAEAEALDVLLGELALLGRPGTRVAWERVERTLLQRLDLERGPARPCEGGAVHIGAFDAMQGIPFRFVAIPGLAEGRVPGPLRPDPFLLDAERETVEDRLIPSSPKPAQAPRQETRQLRLDFEEPARRAEPAWPRRLPTVRDRAQAERRAFHRAIRQARETLVLSYSRADSRTGRGLLPSMFFVAAATALAGRALTGDELDVRVIEDDPFSLPLERTLDCSERDRVRIRRDGAGAAVAASSPFFAAGRRAVLARAAPILTEYDGCVAGSAPGLRSLLDPTSHPRPLSATRLAAFAACGMSYLLRYVLHARPRAEPEERLRLSPLERGTLFHDVAERFLRERMEAGEIPLRDSPHLRERLRTIARERLDALVAGSPPLFMGLWRRERRIFLDLVERWCEREIANAQQAQPVALEVSFGSGERTCALELQPGRTLRLEGRIDRVDRRARDGRLVLRDYKTGRVPRGQNEVFETARRLQMPIYVWAARGLFPEDEVGEAVLDYVDGGRALGMRPDEVSEEALTRLLRGLASAMASGLFMQNPASCEMCDLTSVCGPRAALEWRLRRKSRDRHARALQRLREGA